MKILIVCGSFHPIQSPRSFRSTELAKEFVRQGHTVRVITPRNEAIHDEFEKEYGVQIKDLGSRPKEAKIPSAGIHHWLIRGQKRFLQLFFEYPGIKLLRQVKKTLNSETGYDLLISVAVPHPIHWGVASIWESKRNNKNPARVWVADCGDPFMHAAHDSFPKMPYFHLLENKFLRLADFVTVPFHDMKLLFNKKYRDKFKVIPQGFNFDDTDLPEYKPNQVPLFIYAGVVMPGSRDPFSLINFLMAENYDFQFILYTKQKHQFSAYNSIIGSKLILRDYIPREELIKIMAQADFLVNVNTDSCGGRINAIPTKLIDYRISKRPILTYEQSNLPKSVVREFMSKNYTNAFTDPNFDRYRIDKVVQQFLNLIP